MEQAISANKNKGVFSNDALKIIAVAAMLIDHIAWAFVPLESAGGFVMHFIGRLTIPVMCFFVAQGYLYTKNIKKYALRLFLFALISHFPFFFYHTGSMPASFAGYLESFLTTSVMWPLFLGLVALIVFNQKNLHYFVRFVIITILIILSLVGDWQLWAVIWILIFGALQNNKLMQFIGCGAIALIYVLAKILPPLFMNTEGWAWQLYTLGLFVPLILLWFYDSVRKPSRKLRWLFYIFYPAHLLALALLKYFL